MQKRPFKTYRPILALAILGGTAIFSIYYLYLRPHDPMVSQEFVAQPIQADPSTTINSKVTYRFSNQERRAFNHPTVPDTPTLSETPHQSPGITFIPADTPPANNEQIPQVSGTTALIPSLSDTIQRDNSIPEQKSGETRTAALAPADGLKPPDRDDTNHLMPPREETVEKIPHLEEFETVRPMNGVFTAADKKSEPLADISPAVPPAPAAGIPPRTADEKTESHTNGKASTDTGPRKLTDQVWVINALSTTNEKRQWEIFKTLSKYPYRVYTYTTTVKGIEWKRIRIGFFHSQKEALEAGEKIARQHKLPEPWVLRPAQDEMEKFYLP